MPDAEERFPDADLALVHAETGTIALVFVVRGATDSVDERVLGRRSLILSNYEVSAIHERRRFASTGAMAPLSVSRYLVRDGSGWAPIVSSVVRGAIVSVELLAIGGAHPANQRFVEALIDGIRIHDPAEAEGRP